MRQNEERAALEASLRSVGERLVGAETEDDVARIITVGAQRVLGTHLLDGGLVLDPLDERTGTSGGVLAGLSATMRSSGRPRTSRPASFSSCTGPLRASAAAAPGSSWCGVTLRAALALSTDQPLSDDATDAVVALCREAAIALRAVDQTEQTVRQRSEARFGALIDNSSDIVAVLGEDLRLVYVSPVVHRLLGYPEMDFSTVDVGELIHPSDLAAAEAMLADIRLGVRESVELRLRHVAGTYHWFEVVGADLSDDANIGGIVLNLREIGDRKRAEERLVLSEARFKALVQHSTDVVLVTEAEGASATRAPRSATCWVRTPRRCSGGPSPTCSATARSTGTASSPRVRPRRWARPSWWSSRSATSTTTGAASRPRSPTCAASRRSVASSSTPAT